MLLQIICPRYGEDPICRDGGDDSAAVGALGIVLILTHLRDWIALVRVRFTLAFVIVCFFFLLIFMSLYQQSFLAWPLVPQLEHSTSLTLLLLPLPPSSPRSRPPCLCWSSLVHSLTCRSALPRCRTARRSEWSRSSCRYARLFDAVFYLALENF